MLKPSGVETRYFFDTQTMCKNYLFLAFFILVFSGCKSESDNEILEKVTIDLDFSKNGLFSEIVDDIQYILLSPDGSNFISEPKKIKFDEYQNIYVSDRVLNKLFVFDKSGKMKFTLSPSGKGPKEFIQITDFNFYKDRITILDNILGKILTFDSSGKFLKEIRFKDKAFHFFQNNDYVLKFTSYSSDYNGFNFLKYNLIDGSSSSFVPFPIEKESLGNFDLHFSFINNLNNSSLYYNIPYSYEIVKLDIDNGEFEDLLVLDFDKYNLKSWHYSLRKEGRAGKDKLNREIIKNKLVSNISAFLPFENLNYMNIIQGDNDIRHTILMNKEKNIIFQKKDLFNDLDGLNLNRDPWSFTHDAIVFLDHAGMFMSKYKIINEANYNPLRKNLEEFVEKYKEELNGDYLVLAKYKLKDLIY